MAARRVTRSALDWAAFAERVPANQKEAFKAFKQRADMFLGRVQKFPETMPAIDFTYYKSRVAQPAMVDQFEKQFNSLNIPYPSDPKNLKTEIDEVEKTATEQKKTIVAACQARILECETMLKKLEELPPLDEMTNDMYFDYFNDEARNPYKADRPPLMWPFNQSWQPQNDPHNV